MPIQIKKATRKQKKLRLAVAGQAGAGKTYGALLLADIIGGKNAKILVFDTEAGRASLYGEHFNFDVAEFSEREMGRTVSYKDYIDIIKTAEEEKYDVVILDSTTPEWDDINKIQSNMKGNSFANWGKVKAGPHQDFLNAILYSTVHVICTIRSKEKSDLVEGKVVSRGVDTQQDGNLPFFMDFILSIENRDTHSVLVKKAPIELSTEYEGIEFKLPGKFCDDLKRWLGEGVPEDTYPMIIRIKQLSAEYDELAGKPWEKFTSEKDLYPQPKEVILELGKEIAAEVAALKEAAANNTED